MEFGVQGSGANEFGQLEGWNVGGGYVRVWERRLRGEEADGDQVVEQAEHHHHLHVTPHQTLTLYLRDCIRVNKKTAFG